MGLQSPSVVSIPPETKRMVRCRGLKWTVSTEVCFPRHVNLFLPLALFAPSDESFPASQVEARSCVAHTSHQAGHTSCQPINLAG